MLQIATPTVQTGISLDNHFTIVIGHFMKWVGTFDDQLQAVARLRTRPDVHPVIFLFIDKGTGTGPHPHKNYPVFLNEAEAMHFSARRLTRCDLVTPDFIIL